MDNSASKDRVTSAVDTSKERIVKQLEDFNRSQNVQKSLKTVGEMIQIVDQKGNPGPATPQNTRAPVPLFPAESSSKGFVIPLSKQVVYSDLPSSMQDFDEAKNDSRNQT